MLTIAVLSLANALFHGGLDFRTINPHTMSITFDIEFRGKWELVNLMNYANSTSESGILQLATTIPSNFAVES